VLGLVQRADGEAKASAHLSLKKGLGILELLADRSPQGVTEIARALELEKSGVSRLLQSLFELGYVVQSGRRGQYQLSARVVALARHYLQGDALVREAAPILRELAARARASAHLAVLVDREMIVVAKEASPEPIQVTCKPGNTTPPHASALGKILLAGLAEPEREAFLKGPLPRFTDKTITDPRKVRRMADDIRRKGVAFESGEEHEGVGCIGAPVRDREGRWIASISLSGPLRGTPFRLDARHARLLLQKAAELSSRMSLLEEEA
jgi:DNA-binding IclR family transcriptional regulator